VQFLLWRRSPPVDPWSVAIMPITGDVGWTDASADPDVARFCRQLVEAVTGARTSQGVLVQ
jgi:hypothetical protein